MKRLIKKESAYTFCPECSSLIDKDGYCSNKKCNNSKQYELDQKKQQRKQKQMLMADCPDISQIDDNEEAFNHVEFHYKIANGPDEGKYYRDVVGNSGIFTRNRTKFVRKQTEKKEMSWIQFVFEKQIYSKLINNQIPTDENRVGAAEFAEAYRNGEIDPIPDVVRSYQEGAENLAE